MDIAALTRHPEELGKHTLYELRSLIARYPYYQPARLLLLKNLYLLHDPTFDEELRRAAIYVTDRRRLFELVEEAHYQLRTEKPAAMQREEQRPKGQDGDRTAALIDTFLGQMTADDGDAEPQRTKRKPTPADAAVDYVAYLLETEDGDGGADTPQLKGQALIDDFINNDKGKISLQDETEYEPETEADGGEETSYFTETLARIYIKQGRYSKALEIIQRLNLEYPKKNRYFADQIRFLKKLIINEQ